MRVNQNFLSRCRKFVDVGGQHFQHHLLQGRLFSLFIIMHEQSGRSAVQLICLGGASRFTHLPYSAISPASLATGREELTADVALAKNVEYFYFKQI